VVKQKRSTALAGLAAGILLAAPSAAHPHPEFSPQLVNRYLSVIAIGDRLEFFVSFLYGPLAAVDARKEMDGDGDRKISAAELTAANERWRRRAGELATFSVDGETLPLGEARAEVQIGADDGIGGGPVTVEIFGARPVAAGTRRVRLEPGWDPPRLGETELSIDLSAGWELVASEQGGRVAALSRVKLEGPRKSSVEDRSVTFVIRATAAPGHSRALPYFFGVAALLAAAGIARELWRRRAAR
jgi:hypothetical protein